MTSLTMSPPLQFEELDALEAPSWESFYQGVLAGLTVVGIGVAIAT
ncbi:MULTISPECIES: MpaA1 family daptide-type RiPP [unclassified Microbacterium]|nr:MpaA1 family daptide-type RiPP [Microbacterium sp. B19]